MGGAWFDADDPVGRSRAARRRDVLRRPLLHQAACSCPSPCARTRAGPRRGAARRSCASSCPGSAKSWGPSAPGPGDERGGGNRPLPARAGSCKTSARDVRSSDPATRLARPSCLAAAGACCCWARRSTSWHHVQDPDCGAGRGAHEPRVRGVRRTARLDARRRRAAGARYAERVVDPTRPRRACAAPAFATPRTASTPRTSRELSDPGARARPTIPLTVVTAGRSAPRARSDVPVREDCIHAQQDRLFAGALAACVAVASRDVRRTPAS